MTTGYSSNKDNRGVEEEREKRAKEAAERTRKMHVSSDLASKKNFLFSTKTTIDMKMAVMKTKEIKARVIEGEVLALGMKEKILEQKVREQEQMKQRLAAEENQKKVGFDNQLHLMHDKVAQGMQLDHQISNFQTQIQTLEHEIENKKVQLTKLQTESNALKKKKESLHLNERVDTFGKKSEINAIHSSVEKKAHDEVQAKNELEHIKRQKEMKDKELFQVKKEEAELKREIDQLSKDKVKLESDVKKLELEMR